MFSSGTLFNPVNTLLQQILELNAALTESRIFVAYEPLGKQLNVSHLLGEENPLAGELIKIGLECKGINITNTVNDHGMTLLHFLMLTERFDLATEVFKAPQFTHINYKCISPSLSAGGFPDNTAMSALDMATSEWLGGKNKTVTLEYLGEMLKYGALPLDPNKKFINGDMVETFFPFVIFNNSSAYETADLHLRDKARKEQNEEKHEDADAIEKPTRSVDELVQLFKLFNQYGLSVDAIKQHMEQRLFDTADDWNNRAQEFEDTFGVSRKKQQEVLADFFSKLVLAVKDNPKGELAVTMTAERQTTNIDNLSRPAYMNNQGCRIM